MGLTTVRCGGYDCQAATGEVPEGAGSFYVWEPAILLRKDGIFSYAIISKLYQGGEQ
jgi:hypothetical protein